MPLIYLCISDEERYKLEELKESIKNNLSNQDYELAIISCYQSLSSINNKSINLNNYISKNIEFNKLLDLQFKEIIIEHNISNQINKIGQITRVEVAV